MVAQDVRKSIASSQQIVSAFENKFPQGVINVGIVPHGDEVFRCNNWGDGNHNYVTKTNKHREVRQTIFWYTDLSMTFLNGFEPFLNQDRNWLID